MIMANYDPSQIANLVGQLGGDHQQAARQLQQMGGQIDPRQHGDALQQMGIDPRKLQNGGYQQHLDAQDQPGFQGYRSGDMSGQTPQFGDAGQGRMGRDQMSRGQMGQGQMNQDQMNQDQMGQMGKSQRGQGAQDRSGQNFQQFDQSQGGMRGMKPDPDQQMTDDRAMTGRQHRKRQQQGSRRQGQGQQDYSGRQDR